MAGSERAVVAANPYVGPRPFEPGEKIWGREREIRELYYLIAAERVVLLHSPSGAGKSSMVQAGLLPLLRERYDVWPPTRVNQEPEVAERDGRPVNRYVLSALAGLEEGLPRELRRPHEELAGRSLAEYVAGRPRRPGAPGSVLLIFDQFEEVLTVDPLALEAKRELFEQLGQLLHDPRISALFVLREDYLAPLDPFARQVPTQFKNRFRLDLLGREAAAEAIAEPARQAGRTFDPEALEALVRDLATTQVQQVDGTFRSELGEHVEPVQLQVVCRRLWDRLPADQGAIGAEDLARFGDVTEALAGYYRDTVDQLAGGERKAERAIREWLDRCLITPSGIRDQVLRGEGASGGLDNRLVSALLGTHLVRAEHRAGATWYELAHDRLVEPVRTDNARWRRDNLSEVERRTELWNEEQRPAGLLLTGEELAEAEAWESRHAADLTETEQAFLEASRQAHRRTLRERRQERNIRRLAVASLIALAFALAASFVAWHSSEQARDDLERRLDGQATIAEVSRERNDEHEARLEAEITRMKAELVLRKQQRAKGESGGSRRRGR